MFLSGRVGVLLAFWASLSTVLGLLSESSGAGLSLDRLTLDRFWDSYSRCGKPSSPESDPFGFTEPIPVPSLL